MMVIVVTIIVLLSCQSLLLSHFTNPVYKNMTMINGINNLCRSLLLCCDASNEVLLNLTHLFPLPKNIKCTHRASLSSQLLKNPALLPPPPPKLQLSLSKLKYNTKWPFLAIDTTTISSITLSATTKMIHTSCLSVQYQRIPVAIFAQSSTLASLPYFSLDHSTHLFSTLPCNYTPHTLNKAYYT